LLASQIWQKHAVQAWLGAHVAREHLFCAMMPVLAMCQKQIPARQCSAGALCLEPHRARTRGEVAQVLRARFAGPRVALDLGADVRLHLTALGGALGHGACLQEVLPARTKHAR